MIKIRQNSSIIKLSSFFGYAYIYQIFTKTWIAQHKSWRWQRCGAIRGYCTTHMIAADAAPMRSDAPNAATVPSAPLGVVGASWGRLDAAAPRQARLAGSSAAIIGEHPRALRRAPGPE
jgi:hypothetical protein